MLMEVVSGLNDRSLAVDEIKASRSSKTVINRSIYDDSNIARAEPPRRKQVV